MKVVLLGVGTVGCGVAETIARRTRELKEQGLEFKIVAAVDSVSAAVDASGLNPVRLLAKKKATGTVGPLRMGAVDVIREVDCDVVVEMTPASHSDAEPALTHIREALKASRCVVTANKMPLALHYSKLLEEARRRGVRVLYSACVGAGLPVLEFGATCSKAEPVLSVQGVINATSNFILTEMEQGGMSYSAALKAAQRLGYAETDPTLDVDGIDAAGKLVILANHVMHRDFSLIDVKKVESIREVTQDMVAAARSRNRAVRSVAAVDKRPSVTVTEVDRAGPLAVKGPCNAVVYNCRYSGERVITGPAAGSVTTSLAVLRDLLTLARDGRR